MKELIILIICAVIFSAQAVTPPEPIATCGLFSAGVDQVSTVADFQINLNTTDMPMNGIQLVGNALSCTSAGKYAFSFRPQVTRTAAGLLTIWAKKSGANVPGSSTRTQYSTNAETGTQSLDFSTTLAVGETVSFWAKSTTANSYTIDFTAADATAPYTPAARCSVIKVQQ